MIRYNTFTKLFFARTGILLAGAVLVGPIQSHVAHAVHRLRPVPTAVAHRHVADDAVDDQRSHLLRPLPRSRHQSHSEPRLFATSVPRKGKI